MDLDQRLQKERVEGRVLKQKKLVFLRLPKWKFFPKKSEWLIIIIIIIYLFIYLFNFFGNFDAVGLSWPNVAKEIISRKFIKLFLSKYLFVGIIIIWFHQPCHPPFRFSNTLPGQIKHFFHETPAIFFAGITDLMCFIWLLDRLHFLPSCFSFPKCSLTLPLSSVELAATYTRFIK